MYSVVASFGSLAVKRGVDVPIVIECISQILVIIGENITNVLLDAIKSIVVVDTFMVDGEVQLVLSIAGIGEHGNTVINSIGLTVVNTCYWPCVAVTYDSVIYNPFGCLLEMQIEAEDTFAIGIRNGVYIRTTRMVGLTVDLPIEGRFVIVTNIFRLSWWNVVITDGQLNDNDTIAAMDVL
jgi:hypothetical protein